MSLDTHDYHNPDAPWNQEDTHSQRIIGWENLTEAYESDSETVFKEMQKDLLEEAQEIYDVLKSLDSGLVRKMQKLIDKLK